VLLTQRLQQNHLIGKGDRPIPRDLIKDFLAPDPALRTGHHILYLMQVRASLLHRADLRRFHGSRRRKALPH
jgi:hypothetical protein